MTLIIHRSGRSTQRQGNGFSLIEVMVAVVVLATGLLALAALQGALARNSADAKARGAVAAAMISRLNEFRQAPPADGTTTHTCVSGNWVCTAQTQGSIGSLTFTDNVATMIWKGGTFAALANGDDLTAAQFKRVAMSAQWTDAAGATRTLVMRSDVSSKVYGDGNGYPVPDPTGSAAKFPIVRQDNPSNTAGVIPIVTGNQATAASNPQPIIEGASNNLRVGTSFDVLNYIPEGSTAKISKRFQTVVLKCRCAYGESDYSVAGKAQWPAIWDGTTYSLYPGTGEATGVTAGAGEDPDFAGSAKGKGSGRLQSEQCTECCRDHHDAAGTAAEGKYDPEASGTGKFNEANGVLTAASSGKYVAACRVIKIGGLWRTTADMYQRHFGLLETTTVASVQAKSGIPNSTATGAYQNYVKDYLSQYTSSSTTAPAGAQTMFDEVGRGLNAPATITIATASTSDYRYLHGRGLYVDYLGTKAQAAIGKCTGKSGTAYTECVLPALPFTTINLTEMATWTASDETILNINTNKSLNFNVTEPSGGRTTGIKVGTANNDSVMRTSNSGVAVSDDILGAVDSNGDAATNADSQGFLVGPGSGTGGGTGDSFKVEGIGGILGTNPTWTIPSNADSGNCQGNPAAWTCATNSVLPAAGTITLYNYNQENTASLTFNPLSTAGCTRQAGDNGNINGNPSVTVTTMPRFTDYTVQSVANGGTAIIASPVNAGKADESTSISLSAIPKAPAVVTVTLQAGTVTNATVATCVYKKSSGGVSIVSITWNRPWL